LILPSFIPSTSAKSRNASGPNSTFSIRSSLKQTSMFLFQRGQQFIQRMGEGGDAIGQHFLCDFRQEFCPITSALVLYRCTDRERPTGCAALPTGRVGGTTAGLGVK
jgi:hypothetical protein